MSSVQNRVMVVLAAALVMSVAVSNAGAFQEAPSATQPETKPAAKARSKARAQPLDPNLLAGPKVEDEAQTREVPRLRQGDGDRRGNDEVPFAMWVTALRGLGLSADQQAQARTIAREFEKSAREFRDSQPEEVREAMRQAREMREQGQPVPRDIREKIVKVDANAPRPQPYQERIWALLTSAQQDQMKTSLDQMRTNMRRRQAERNTMDSPPPDSMEKMPMISDEQPGAATQPEEMDRAPTPP